MGIYHSRIASMDLEKGAFLKNIIRRYDERNTIKTIFDDEAGSDPETTIESVRAYTGAVLTINDSLLHQTTELDGRLDQSTIFSHPVCNPAQDQLTI